MAKRKLIPPQPAAPKVEGPDPLGQVPEALEDDWKDIVPNKCIPRTPRAELAQFVMDFCDGRVFTSAHIREGDAGHLLHMVFLPLALGGLSGIYDSEVQNIGLVWEFLSKAGPRSINGYPMFFSCRLMHKDDWAIALKAIAREEKRRKTSLKSILDE